MNRTLPYVASVALVLCGWVPAHARPAHKQALAQYFGSLLPKALNDCRLCHLPDPAGQKVELDAEKPHNIFGARLKAARDEVRKAGKGTSIEARIDFILNEDTDKDGVSNILEILTGHFPHDPKDRPSRSELAQAGTTFKAFEKARRYPWRPFETVQRPGCVPETKNTAWIRNPIDAFIAAEHEALGLKPRPEAAREVLLRRVYLDLIGLPPMPEKLHAFLADKSPDAYEKVVDRLLANPQYGERWGRHWMDIWRYSDWAGYGPQVRDSQPHIWRWRDWIVESLNNDQGYDRMVLEMLAGDELAPEDPKALAATGYLVRNFKLLSREKWLQDTVDHTAQAFLGLTLGCAKCHDHMYDPIAQKEYYEIRAIFEPHQVRIDRLPGQPDTKLDGIPRVYDADLKAVTHLYIRGDDRTPDKSKPLAAGVLDILGGEFNVQSVSLPPTAICPDRRDFVIKDTIKASEDAVAKARAKLEKFKRPDVKEVLEVLGEYSALELAEVELSALEAKHTVLLKSLEIERLEETGKKDDVWTKAALNLAEAQRNANLLEARRVLLDAKKAKQAADQKKPAAVLAAEKKLTEAEKAFAKAEADLKKPVDTNYTKRDIKTYPTQSTGRRLAFARWIADKQNPLTARVAVNHIWLRHFGQAIVPTVADFGRNGQAPSHPALLDWLAAEFMQKWSMKHIHRLIVTSSTYRQASTPDVANAVIDRDNKYLWRMQPRRLEGEAVRDSIFYVAGRLDQKMGGPDIDQNQGLTVPRRTIYFRHAAEKEMVLMQIFDGPSVTECYERKPSILPQQALALLNSDLTVHNARVLARKLSAKMNGDAAAFTKSAFEHVLSRSPTAAELSDCVAFLQQANGSGSGVSASNDPDGRQPSTDPALRARENLVHVLMNHHEFVTIR